jgi:selenide,water dikinase
VLVDFRTGDDAGVFRLESGELLVQTVDFFTPVVDDPFAFGGIAAANALSDVYAMGGRALTALSVAAIPTRDFPAEWTRDIFAGGAAKLAEAGCALLGGHTIRDPEVKFGYAVTGLVPEGALLTNAGARAGDVVVLTKPLGTGTIATAQKKGVAPESAIAASTESMLRLNRAAAEAARSHRARAATDVTGFGLAGHALGVARESAVSIEFHLGALPLLPHAEELALLHRPGGARSNEEAFASRIDEDEDAASSPARRALMFDPQTSGGLLLFLDPGDAQGLLETVQGAAVIGRVSALARGRLRLRA